MLRFVVGFVLLLSLVHGQEPPPLTEDNTAILDVQGRADVNPQSWTDSYSVGDACYCLTTFDHDIGEYIVEISTLGNITVRQACELVGPGPGAESRPVCIASLFPCSSQSELSPGLQRRSVWQWPGEHGEG